VFPFTLLYIRANGQRQSRAPGFSFVVRACPEVSKDIEPRTSRRYNTSCETVNYGVQINWIPDHFQHRNVSWQPWWPFFILMLRLRFLEGPMTLRLESLSSPSDQQEEMGVRGLGFSR